MPLKRIVERFRGIVLFSGLFPEQIGVRSCTVQIELLSFLAINKKPVGRYMALSVPGIVSAQIVIGVLHGQGLRYSQCVDYLLEQIQFVLPFYADLKIFLEPGRISYIKHLRPP